MSALFEFHMRIVDRNVDPYYYANWDRAKPIVCRGATEKEAAQKAAAAMGPAPAGRYWIYKVDRIVEAAS